MIIGISVLIMTVLSLFSLLLGENLIGNTINVLVDNTALINGSTTTFVVSAEDILFQVDTSVLINAGIALIVAVGFVATITGVQVLGSGLNAQSARVLIIIAGYTGIWTALSIVAFQLITSIEVFGSLIYIAITIGYAVGVVQKLSGGE